MKMSIIFLKCTNLWIISNKKLGTYTPCNWRTTSMLFEKNKNKKRKNRRRPTVIESINQCKLPLIIQSRISLNLCTYFVRSLVRSSASPFVRPPLSRNPNYRSRSWSMDEQRMRLRRRERMRVGPKKYSTNRILDLDYWEKVCRKRILGLTMEQALSLIGRGLKRSAILPGFYRTLWLPF